MLRPWQWGRPGLGNLAVASLWAWSSDTLMDWGPISDGSVYTWT